MARVGPALVLGARNDPSILLNRTLGLDATGAPRPEHLAEIEDLYRGWGVGRHFVHLHTAAAPPEVLARAEELGLAEARAWMTFHRRPAALRQPATSLTIRKAGPSEAPDFGRIVASAFDLTPAAAPLLAALTDDPRWHLFVSYDGDAAAGAGALFVSGEAALLDWGATDPAFRRRGSQGAIMAARISLAHDLGCAHVFTETGAAAGDDPQHSYGNILRYGFGELSLRQNLAPAPPR